MKEEMLGKRLFSLLILGANVVQIVDAAASCVTMNLNNPLNPLIKLTNPCAEVVNYAFYLPNGVTEAQLQAAANANLADTSLKVLSTGCQNALRNAVCANVYLKCNDGVVIGTPATYNLQIYQNDVGLTVPVPFQRPCRDVCDNANEQCKGLYNLAGKTAQNCTALKDYSGGAVAAKPDQYGQVGDSKCFLPKLDVPVSPSQENYLFKNTGGACAGITDTLYAPPGPLVNAAFSVIQKPGAMQSVIEPQLKASLSQIPSWVSEECHLALNKYICGQYYLKAETKTVGTILTQNNIPATPYQAGINGLYPGILATNVILPSYEANSVCIDFQTKCAGFITLQPSLTPNCSAAINAVVDKFPSAPQPVGSFPRPAGWPGSPNPIVLITSPNAMATVDTSLYVWEQSCPYGYVVPEHPDNPRVQWVPNTPCAAGCKIVEWTKDEWHELEEQSIAIPITGAILTGFLMITFLWKREDFRDNYLVFIFTVLAFIASVASCVVNDRKFSDRFCYDNAIQSNQVDNSESVCVAQGVILTYVLLACCAINFMQIIDAFLKINEFHSIYDNYSWVGFQLFFALILPLIPVITAGSLQYYGFSKTQPFCFVQNYPYAPSNSVTGLVDLPVLIVHSMTLIVFIAACVSYRRRNQASTDHKHELHILYHVLPAMCFVFMMFAVWWGYIIAKGALYGWSQSRWIPSVKAFTQCLFQNYGQSGNSDHAYDVCGPHPTRRPSGGLVNWLIVCLTGTSIIIAAVYLTVWLIRTFCPILPNPNKEDKENQDSYGHVKATEAPVEGVEMKSGQVSTTENAEQI